MSTGYIYGSKSNQRSVRDVLLAAKTGHQRVALFGDSQETSPGGRGTQYLNQLNYQLLARLTNGVCSESLVQNVISETGHWLGRAGRQTVTVDSVLDPNEILPNIGSAVSGGDTTITLRNVGQILTNDGSGFIHLLDYNANNAATGSGVPVQAYIDNTATFNYDAFVVQFDGAPDLAYRFHGGPSSAPTYFNVPNGETSTVQTISGTNGTGGIVKITIEDLTLANPSTNPYPNMVLGSSTTTGIPIIGGRYVSQTNVGGIGIQGFSIGGYQTDDLLDNHVNAGPMLRAFGPYSMVMFQFGANDVYSGNKGVTEIIDDLEANIDAVRGPNWLDRPSLPIVIITEAPRINGTGAQDTVADALQRALRELAYTKNNVVTIDARAWVERNTSPAWTREQEETSAVYLDDDVHYTAEGGRVYGNAVATLLEDLSGKRLDDPLFHIVYDGSGSLATPGFTGQRRR